MADGRSESGWDRDPTGRHEARYWSDGWTDQVHDKGWLSTDTMECDQELSDFMKLHDKRAYVTDQYQWLAAVPRLRGEYPRLISDYGRLVSLFFSPDFVLPKRARNGGLVILTDTKLVSYDRTLVTKPTKTPEPVCTYSYDEITMMKLDRTHDKVELKILSGEVTNWYMRWASLPFFTVLEALAYPERRLIQQCQSSPIPVLHLGGSGYPFNEDEVVAMYIEADQIVFDRSSAAPFSVAMHGIENVEVGGRGMVTTGGGFIGGGFGLTGFVIGAATSAAANRLTQKTNVETLLRISTNDGEINLFTSEILPQDLDLLLAPVRTNLTTRRSASSVSALEQLERLSVLHEANALTDEEFEAQKQRLLLEIASQGGHGDSQE